MARPLHFYQKKRLREDNRKDEPILDRTLATGGGSRKVGLARRLNARSQNDRPRRGQNQERPFLTHQISWLYPQEDQSRRKGYTPDTPWVTMKG